MKHADIKSWARTTCQEVVRTSRIIAMDGTILFTPDGVGHYGAQWTRDFAYLVEHGAAFLDRQEVRKAIEVQLAGQRADGAVPDRMNAHLVPFYFPGDVSSATHVLGNGQNTSGSIGAVPALDNPMFLVSLVYYYHRHFSDAEFVQAVLPALRRGLDWLPLNRALVFNDSQRPSSTYGFQDTVAKGGHDLFCSLLHVIACRQMAELEPSKTVYWRDRAASTEENLGILWDDERGAYLAASEVCRQVDVWGNAFAVAHGIGDSARRKRVAQFLVREYDSFVYAGQVRHLPAPEFWERMFRQVSEGTYQNGGYWGTASGWLIQALQTVAPDLAARTLRALLQDYIHNGVLEWVSPRRGKGPDLYVATILNIWTLLNEAQREKTLL